MSNYRAAIIVHGGAGPLTEERLSGRLKGCEQAALTGWKLLQEGKSALDAVATAVMALEDNPLFNAGTGSTLNVHGQVEMDAAIMDGEMLSAGAVAAVSKIKNPINLARKVLEDGRHVLLGGEGAHLFARQSGIPEYPPELLIVEDARRRWEKQHGTVGCVALDQAGRLAVGTSTGGMFDKLPGRIGDSSLLGCGTYADKSGGVSCTGNGEAIIRVVMAKSALEFLSGGSHPMEAAEKAVAYLKEKADGQGGLIIVDRAARVGYARNTSHMPVCVINGPGKVITDS
jgi:beta-aspartyl-peptidase (threonine type)